MVIADRINLLTTVKFVGIIYKLINRLPDWCLRTLYYRHAYYAYMHPHIIYGVEICGDRPTFASNLEKLQKVNNEIPVLHILQHKEAGTSLIELY
jgi:hypothetical protein